MAAYPLLIVAKLFFFVDIFSELSEKKHVNTQIVGSSVGYGSAPPVYALFFCKDGMQTAFLIDGFNFLPPIFHW